MYQDGQSCAPCGETSGAYVVSALTMIMGYCLFVAGTVLPSWRTEIGYTYGLWVRCDGHVCSYVFVGFTSYMGVVQGGIIISIVLLTTSMLCLLLEGCIKSTHSTTPHLGCIKSTHSTTPHLARTSTAVAATAGMGEILAAFTLAYYGYKTVMAIERLPVLTTGFALAGLGIMALLLGSILRAMGPPGTWGDGVCCMAPTHGVQKRTLYILGADSPSVDRYKPAVGDGKASRAGPGPHEVDLISCFHKTKKGQAYSSVPSTARSSLDTGYRHYEEIIFQDMPHPSLEMLSPHPLAHPGTDFRQDSTPPQHYHLCLYSHVDTELTSVSSSFQCLEQQQQQRQQQQYTMYQPHNTENTSQYITRSQQTEKQRSIVTSARRHCSTPTQDAGTLTTQHGCYN